MHHDDRSLASGCRKRGALSIAFRPRARVEKMKRLLCATAMAIPLVTAFASEQASIPVAATVASSNLEFERVLKEISIDSLRGNLSFLASDALNGRYTPSPGLDVAAEFIASRFRSAGLKPAGEDNSYFQVADLTEEVKKRFEKRGRTPPTSVIARNVVAILPGSDPKLKDTYILLSAHYDHLGTLKTSAGLSKAETAAEGDEIFNGANDDGSGTVSVIEIATAFAKLPHRPRRSIVFLTFCGEELGLLGSKYYVQHPLLPLSETIADINLEQVGRSDGDFGKDRATVTGYDFTDLPQLFEQAAKSVRITMVKTKETEPYFRASDNYSFATAGIPDLTFGIAYEFPDYHGLKDEWQKIDFPEMVRVDQLAARVLWTLANREQLPHWNAGNPKTDSFRHVPARPQ